MLLTLTNYMQRHKVLRIFFIMFLILCILFVGCMASINSVYALNPALVGPALTVVSAILVAAGLHANSDSALTAACNDYYRYLPTGVISELSVIIDSFASWANPSAFTFKITQAISDSVASFINRTYKNGNLSVSGTIVVNGVDLSFFPGVGFMHPDNAYSYNKQFFIDVIPSDVLPLSIPALGSGDSLTGNVVIKSNSSGSYNWGSTVFDRCALTFNSGYLYFVAMYAGRDDAYSYIPLCKMVNGEFVSGSYSVSSGSTVPVYTSYFPSGVLEGAGATTYPSGTASKPLDTGTTVAIPSTGVNAGTDVGSVRVPGGTATGDSTGVIGFLEKILAALQGLLENILSLPVAIYNALAGAFTSILDAIKSLAGTITGAISGAFADIKTFIGKLFDTSEFKLDFSKFKFKLTEIFPFCIPFDFVKGIKTLVANSSGFVFNLKLNTPYFKFNHTVDLTPFKVPILFFRFIVDFWFCFILISRTRDWIKW